jgi:hypothetical protein
VETGAPVKQVGVLQDGCLFKLPNLSRRERTSRRVIFDLLLVDDRVRTRVVTLCCLRVLALVAGAAAIWSFRVG